MLKMSTFILATAALLAPCGRAEEAHLTDAQVLELENASLRLKVAQQQYDILLLKLCALVGAKPGACEIDPQAKTVTNTEKKPESGRKQKTEGK